MHPSSVENMRICRAKYLQYWTPEMPILDVGGRGLNKDRSYRQVFPEAKVYSVADILDGKGVTHVMAGPYELPFEDDSFDLILSGQMLEHCKNPFRSVAEMARVLKQGCRMALIAPSAGPKHDTIDCWRFMDDSFAAIAEETGLKIIADWIQHVSPDERSMKWRDHVFVGEKP